MKVLQQHVTRPTFDDPLYSQKNPHQTFLLIFGLYAAIPLLFGKSSGSGALDAAVDHAVLFTWGAILLAGSAFALVGEFWPGRTYFALVLERTGVALVGTGALFYVTVLLATTDWNNTRYLVSVIAAYAVSCVWRVFQITRRLAWLRRIISEVELVE